MNIPNNYLDLGDARFILSLANGDISISTCDAKRIKVRETGGDWVELPSIEQAINYLESGNE